MKMAAGTNSSVGGHGPMGTTAGAGARKLEEETETFKTQKAGARPRQSDPGGPHGEEAHAEAARDVAQREAAGHPAVRERPGDPQPADHRQDRARARREAAA